jgi:hypothetical protein
MNSELLLAAQRRKVGCHWTSVGRLDEELGAAARSAKPGTCSRPRIKASALAASPFCLSSQLPLACLPTAVREFGMARCWGAGEHHEKTENAAGDF